MAVHWVNYDLNQSGKDYDGLISYLQSHDAWARPVKSSFLVVTSLTAAQLRDGMLDHLDANDDTLVISVSGESWASYGLSEELNTWLSQNL